VAATTAPGVHLFHRAGGLVGKSSFENFDTIVLSALADEDSPLLLDPPNEITALHAISSSA
jgi:hypothetical protein